MKDMITVQTVVNTTLAKAWEFWNKPEHINGWAFTSSDWEARALENDLRAGGKFKTIMGAKDKSMSFDFTGTYSAVQANRLIEYDMSDGRHVKVEFADTPSGIKIIETFEPEKENPTEMQRFGWQAILDNFKKYTETRNK